MKEYFAEKREQINATIDELFDSLRRDLQGVNSWGPDALDRLKAYMGGGKMIRGGLVFLGEELFESPRGENARRIAAAMELLQAFLLIHDDIMDRDEMRRGKPSMHTQYRKVAGANSESLRLPGGEAGHLGEALAICVGDISAFLSLEFLAQIDVSDSIRRKVTRLLSREIVRTGVAQMQDVYNGYVRGDVERENIMSVYTYKTGRYTFSLPLTLGALLAGQEDETLLEALGEIGERLGRVFQIRDDQLGLFGEAEAIGKPVGSDVAEDKKTIVRALLYERAEAEERSELEGYFGNPRIGEREIARVRAIASERGVVELLDEAVELENETISTAIEKLPLEERGRALLRRLFEYNRSRSV